MASPSDPYSLSNSGRSDRTGQEKPPSAGRRGADPGPLPFMPPPRKARQSRRMPVLVALLALAVVAVPGIAWFRAGTAPVIAEVPAPPAAAPVPAAASDTPAPGTASITSFPEGASVSIDGELRGTTPLRLSMAPGSYSLELRRGNISRVLPLAIESNTTVEPFADLSPSLATSGRLEITTDPAGAEITVNGVARGRTPLVLAAVPAGQYRVTLADGTMTVNRTVDVVAGATVNVAATMSRAASANGWVSINSPLQLQVSNGGRVIGTSGERIALPVGTYELQLSSADYQFTTTASVRVLGARTVDVAVDLPTGTLAVNAVPWADVWLDGHPIGQTPLGRVSVAIGEHEVVWRHPQFGERRQTVRITSGAITRAGVDFKP